MADVFLSYTHSDGSAAEALAKALAEHGWSVFWDRTIPVGKTWDQVLESELTAARCIVVLWSSASVSSEWVRVEAEEAASRKILIPVLLEDGVTIPLRFRALQAAWLVDWKDNLEDSPSFKPLIRAIEELSGAPVGVALVQPSGARRKGDGVRGHQDIYLGYARGSTARARRIKQYLADSGVDVLDWAEFRPGSTILEELEQAAKRCKGAVFLFTKDDSLVTRGSGGRVQANLIFELGFFVHAVGRDRVAIVVERGVTLPADIAGLVFFDPSDISTVLSKLKGWLGR